MINIKGLDKAKVLKALYDASHVQGMGFLQAVPDGTVTVPHCRELLKHGTYFDYLYGRVLKVDLSGDEFDERLYERDNGRDSAARAIAFLKKRCHMDILIGKRQQGKTTHLIKMSAAGEGIIVAPTEHGAAYIKTLAKEMGLDIPEPVNWSRFTQNGWARGHKGPYLIDELGEILRGVNIKTAILDDECNIEYLSGGPLHYGDELTAKIKENTKDFSKLSDFDKFVLDNGYRYETREALQAGYERHWKAAHDILISLEEFLIEAEKQPSDPATDVYNALVDLVEEKKLRPGEVLNYAHFHWCLDTPEAIVAWQTGRDKWTVNNCSTEITEEAALIKICEEWGFETGRTHIIGTPYYDATDYQFIRFNCAHMAWLWQNGNLLQVYC